MKKNLFNKAFVVFAILLSWDCAKDTNPIKANDEETFSGNLEINTEKPTYNINEVWDRNYVIINAVLINTTKDTFYTKLGDGMDGSIEQEYLSIAQHTDGRFEKNVSENKWENLNLGMMIEGSKVVRILPSKNYNLTAVAYLDADSKGKFRLKVNYFKSYPQAAVDTLTDVSNSFDIKSE